MQKIVTVLKSATSKAACGRQTYIKKISSSEVTLKDKASHFLPPLHTSAKHRKEETRAK